MKKISGFKLQIMLFGIIYTGVILSVYLIFGKYENKLSTTVFTVFYPVIVFAFVMLFHTIWRKQKAYKLSKFFTYFLSFGGVFAVICGSLVSFSGFTNMHLVWVIGVGFALLTSSLYAYGNLYEK